ncbi:MAG TPA: hypothetical protein VKO38_03070 [Wenzhouxiangella sp.]|nr:hypothetical protein [Wenzhouxiangella sp.]
MKIKNFFLASAVVALSASPMIASAQESDNSILSMTRIYLEPLAGMSFGAAMNEYIECYEENGGDNSWTAWRDMESSVVWIVSNMDGWAEMDQERGEAEGACWSILVEKMPASVIKMKTDYARYMADWSDPSEDFNVVRLHQFMVDEGDDFRETVGEMTSMLKEAEHEHVGAWYGMIGSDADEIDYFQVSQYENFAEIDADRPNYNSVMVEEMGEEKAEEMWDELFDSVADYGYKTVLLSRMEDWSYDPGEE